MSNIPSKLSKLFSCGERLNALDLNSIVSVYNDIIDYLNNQGSNPGTGDTLNWPLNSINSAGLSDNGGTRYIGTNMVIASTGEKNEWQWLQINNNTGLLWDDLNGGKGNDNTIIDPTHIPLATDNAVGGIKLGFTQIDNKYPVLLDDGKAYVEVLDMNATSILGKSIDGTLSDNTNGYILKYNAGEGKWKLEEDLQGSSNPGDNPGSGITLLDVWKSLTKNDGLSNLTDPSLLKISNDYLNLDLSSFFNSAGSESSNPLKNYTWWGRSLEKVGDYPTVSGNLEGNILYIKFEKDDKSIYLGIDDSGNLKVYHYNSNTPANFYATGGVSALGIGSSGEGSGEGFELEGFLGSLKDFTEPITPNVGYLHCYIDGDKPKLEWSNINPVSGGINITGGLPSSNEDGTYVLLYLVIAPREDPLQEGSQKYIVSSTKYEPLVNSVLKQINDSTSIEAKSNDEENLGKHSLYYEVTSKTTTNNNGEEVTTYSGQWMWNKVGNNSELNKILTGINSDQDLNSFIDSTHNEASNKILYYKIVKKKEAVTDPNDETVIISPAEYSGTWQWGDFKEAVGLGNILSSIDGLDGLNLPPNNLESDKILHYVVTENTVDDPENPGNTTTTYDFGWQFMDLSSIKLKNEVLIHLNNSNTKFVHPSSVIEPDLNNSNYTYLNAGAPQFRINSGINNAIAVSKYYDTVFIYLSVLCEDGQVIPYWKTCEFNTTLISKLSKIDDKVANLNRKSGYLHRTKSYNDFTYEWVDNIEGDLLNEPLKTLNGVSFPEFDDYDNAVTNEEGETIYGESGKKILTCEAIHKQNQGTQTEYTEYVWKYEPYSNGGSPTIYLGIAGIEVDGTNIGIDLAGQSGLFADNLNGLGIKLIENDNKKNISGLEINNSGLGVKTSSGLEIDSNGLGLKVKLATSNSGLTFDDGGLKINIANDDGLKIEGGVLKLSSTGANGLLWSDLTGVGNQEEINDVHIPVAPIIANISGTISLGYGGIRLGYQRQQNEQDKKKYPVETDTYGRAYVEVPWTEGNGNDFTLSVNGSELTSGSSTDIYVPTSSGGQGQILLSGGNGNSPTWSGGTAGQILKWGDDNLPSWVTLSRTLWGLTDTFGNIGTSSEHANLNFVKDITMYGNISMLSSNNEEGGEIMLGGGTGNIHLDNFCPKVGSTYDKNNLKFRVFGSYIDTNNNNKQTHFGQDMEYYPGQGGLCIGSYIQIGTVKIINDSSNTLKIECANGTAGSLYATGGLSALGLSSGSSPSISNLTVNNVLTVSSASNGNNNGIVFTGNPSNRLYCEGGNIKSTGPFVFNSEAAQGNIYVDHLGFHVNNGEGFHFGDYELYMLDNTLKLKNNNTTTTYTISMTKD